MTRPTSPSGSACSASSGLQVQRVELQNLLSKDFSLDDHLSSVRSELTKGVTQLDDLLENATQFVETSLQPAEAQLPATVTA